MAHRSATSKDLPVTVPPTGSGGPQGTYSWRRWVESWYLAYTLLGATVAGMVPILLPLTVSRGHGATQVGAVMATLSLGGLTAPVWGWLADRHRLHRALLIGGLFLTAAALAAFAFTATTVLWLLLALLQGVGSAAAATIANLFVVEAHPQGEWDARIGWLQTFYGAGQVGGLLLAGITGQADLRLGLLVAAALPALALLPAWLWVRTPFARLSSRPALLHPARHGEWTICSPQRLFHHLTWQAVRRAGITLRSPFGLFLVAWGLSYGGTAAVFCLYPVLMERVFGIQAALSAWAFGGAAALGLALYSLAGRWSARSGSVSVLRLALSGRLAAFLALLILGVVPTGGRGPLALLAFLFVVLAWSLLSVSGTALTAELSPVGEGEGMGFFNATTALAGVFGSAAGGWIAGNWGYCAAPALALAGVTLGLVVASLIPRVRRTVEPARASV